jgi:hypothetical protein
MNATAADVLNLDCRSKGLALARLADRNKIVYFVMYIFPIASDLQF